MPEEILTITDRSMVGVMYGSGSGSRCMDYRSKGGKTVKDFILMLGFYETMDQLAMADIVWCYGHVFYEERTFMFLRRALEFDVEGRMGDPKGFGRSTMREKA